MPPTNKLWKSCSPDSTENVTETLIYGVFKEEKEASFLLRLFLDCLSFPCSCWNHITQLIGITEVSIKCYPSLWIHTSVCCELKEATLPFWLRSNWQKLADRLFWSLVPLFCLCLSRVIKLSISFSFSCSSFKKKSTSTLFSFLICSLMSLGMSGIIQSTRTLRNITKFCKHSSRHETRMKDPKYFH